MITLSAATTATKAEFPHSQVFKPRYWMEVSESWRKQRDRGDGKVSPSVFRSVDADGSSRITGGADAVRDARESRLPPSSSPDTQT
jgi:hypothetical protein